jgi:2-dehydro-3-deoxyphosphooctonate aldolase (KDO 8-P synthase)
MRRATIAGITVGQGHPLALIAGPCVVESDDVMRRSAGALREICAARGVPLIFKASYEKDNRSAAAAHRGPGLMAGLAALARVRAEFGLPLTTDVHRPSDVAAAAQVVDLLQVPALLCRQSSLLEAVGASGQAVNVKKGQFLDGRAMAGAVEKVRAVGATQVLLTERGTAFGSDGLVCDLEDVALMQGLGCPVVLDAGHAANARDQIAVLARCGVAAGADVLFVECHPDPARALCDGKRMLTLVELDALLGVALPIAAALRRGR